MSFTLKVNFIRLILTVICVAQAFQGVMPASAQRETGVFGSSYSSPTFAYSLEWDDETWTVEEEFSEPGYDALVLDSDRARLFFEGVHQYQGDPEDCRGGERLGLAEEADLDDLTSVTDEDGEPIESDGRTWASGLYEVPESADDDEIIAYVYLECQTVIPETAVLIITAFIDADDLDDQLELIEDVVDTIEMPDDADQGSSVDSDNIEQDIRNTARDVDAFWAGVFEAVDDTYVSPTYITFMDQIESDCGDAVAGETGPFYCPADQTVYLDLYAMTYLELPYGFIVIQMVVAHEIAHHVQELRGLDGCADSICGRAGRSLAIELQADCFAGAWMADAASREVVQQRDIKRLEGAIKAWLADPPDTEKNDPEAHGDGNMRFLMFMKGYAGGITACGFA